MPALRATLALMLAAHGFPPSTDNLTAYGACIFFQRSLLERHSAPMVEPSQLFNRMLGRNTDTGGVEFWRQPERSGWLLKQGKHDPKDFCSLPGLHARPLTS